MTQATHLGLKAMTVTFSPGCRLFHFRDRFESASSVKWLVSALLDIIITWQPYPSHSNLSLNSHSTSWKQSLSFPFFLDSLSYLFHFLPLLCHYFISQATTCIVMRQEKWELLQSLAQDTSFALPLSPDYLIQLLIMLIKVDITSDAERIKRFLNYTFFFQNLFHPLCLSRNRLKMWFYLHC